jgi:hypothetical protein
VPPAREVAGDSPPVFGRLEQQLARVAGIGMTLDVPALEELPDELVHRLRANVLRRRQPGIRDRAFLDDPPQCGGLRHRQARQRRRRLLAQTGA